MTKKEKRCQERDYHSFNLQNERKDYELGLELNDSFAEVNGTLTCVDCGAVAEFSTSFELVSEA